MIVTYLLQRFYIKSYLKKKQMFSIKTVTFSLKIEISPILLDNIQALFLLSTHFKKYLIQNIKYVGNCDLKRLMGYNNGLPSTTLVNFKYLQNIC